MKIRTKLIGLLSGLLLLVILTSTLAGWIMLRRRVDKSVQEDLQSTAGALANTMEDYLQSAHSDDDVAEKLESVRRRYPLVVKLALSFATEEGETVQVVLPAGGEVEVSRPKAARHTHGEKAQLYEARRALFEHGESLRAPAFRGTEPLWRINERGPSTRWKRNLPAPQTARRSREFKTREDRAACQSQHCLTTTTPVDPVGPQRGTLEVTVASDRYGQVLRDQLRISAYTTLIALLILLLASVWIVDRVVAHPVAELELAMFEVQQGDLRRRVTTARNDEIGNLGSGFNAMLDRLAQADEEIRGLNSRLADDIAAATKDLQHKNEALDQLNQLLVQIQRELGDKERLAALGQLAAQLAHEIGTPLASVSGHLQLATYARDVPPPLRERLQVAIGELGRVSKIIRDYLDQTRTAKPTLVRTDLRRVVEEAVQVGGSAARRPGVRIVTEIDPRFAEVQTDPGLVRQILINLITNALDASAASENSGPIAREARSAAVIGREARGAAVNDRSAANGSLTPSSGKVVVSVRQGETPQEIELAVKDNGAGIASDDLVRIFEPFYTTKGRGKGTGLGLSICRELARTLGGKIKVDSAAGRGSEFAVVLPHTSAQP